MIENIGWLLVHSIWQFAAWGLIALILLKCLSRASSATRYAVLVGLLLMMILAPVVTYWFLPDVSQVVAEVEIAPGLVITGDTPPAADPHFEPDPFHDPERLPNLTTEIEWDSSTGETGRTAIDDHTGHAGSHDDEPGEVTTSSHTIHQALAPWLDGIVGIWFAGMLLFSLRPLSGWYTIRRLSTKETSAVPDDLLKLLRETVERLGVTKSVRIFQSSLATVPLVTGFLRPLILLPASVVTGLPPAQLQAILAHELAHIRRYDQLVNLWQTLVETIFFYHPLVWWLSHRIRCERENCCDDLAITVSGNRIDYSRALLALEELRDASPALALSSHGGSLTSRIKRLVIGESRDDRTGFLGIAAFLGLLVSLAVCVLCLSWEGQAAATLQEQGERPVSAREPTFGPEAHGLQFRLVALSTDVNDESPDLKRETHDYARSADVTFGVELKNVSDKKLTLAGIRYGENYQQSVRGKLRTEMLAPHFFDFEFFDRDGKPLPRTQREFYQGWHVADSASVHELNPGESLIEVLRPGKFNVPMDHDLPPGEYAVRVRYRGPDDTLRRNVRKHWPDKPILNAWPHEVESNPVQFSVAERSNRMRPADLKWGKPVDGLQAALEYRLPEGVTGNPLTTPGVPVGTKLGVVFHLRNVSDKPITFVSETGRQGDTVHVTDERGEEVEVKETWFWGMPIDVAWTLQPGETAQLHVLAPAINTIDRPGRYTVRYTVRFNSRGSKDADGNVIFPRPGDYQSEVDTGETPLVLYEPPRETSQNGETLQPEDQQEPPLDEEETFIPPRPRNPADIDAPLPLQVSRKNPPDWVISGDGDTPWYMQIPAFLPDNTLLFVGADGKQLEVHDPKDGTTIRSVTVGERTIHSLMMSHDRRRVVYASQPLFDRTKSDFSVRIEVRDLPSLELVGKAIEREMYWDQRKLAISSAGKFIALSDVKNPNGVSVWEVESGKQIKEAPVPVGIDSFNTLAFSPDGRWLVISSLGDLIFWEWQTEKPPQTIHVGRHTGSLAFTHDSRYLYEGPDSRRDIQVRDLKTMKVVRRLKDDTGHSMSVNNMQFIDGGKTLVAGNAIGFNWQKLIVNDRLHFWDIETGKILRKFDFTRHEVYSVAVSPNGRYLVAILENFDEALIAGWDLQKLDAEKPD